MRKPTKIDAPPTPRQQRRSTAHLDALADRHHLTYKVPGLLTWSILGLSLVGTLLAPQLFLAGARLFTFYLLARLAAIYLLYPVGILRCRALERQAAAIPAGVHHVVVIPNYREPVAILQRVLHSLARQEDARRHLTVVLAMEEREEGALDKAHALQARFDGRFARILITRHPSGLPGEIPCKGSNQAWAARQAKRELVDHLGMDVERITLTTCDADAVFHPRYFAELARRFAGDPARHQRLWYAPVFLRNNIWQVPTLIRLMSFPGGPWRLAELANPLSFPLPVSTYSLSLALADAAGYWDPAVISEDWHMLLRCFFATGGRLKLVAVFLPTATDAVDDDTALQALVSYYRQQLRHAWGAEDVGYILQQWRRTPEIPARRKFQPLFWVLHQHLMRSTTWIIIGLGALVSTLSHDTPILTTAGSSAGSTLLQVINLLALGGGLVLWLVERLRARPYAGSPLLALAQELAAWVLLPLLGLVFNTLPGLHAQTRLMLGLPLTYRRTPKRVR